MKSVPANTYREWKGHLMAEMEQENPLNNADPRKRRSPQPGETQPGVCWITGASSGIGRSLSLALARQGWRVAVSSRDALRLEALSVECACADRLRWYPLDVTDPAAVLQSAEDIQADLGLIDLAIFNAGSYRPMPLDEFDVALFRHLFEVNYLGVVHGIAAVLPEMRARRAGQILVMGSVAGYRGLPRSAPYNATKSALINLAESLKNELQAVGIRIRVVNPGFVRTPLTAKNAFRMPALITPDEAAAAIVKELSGDGFEITFPKRFTYWLKLLRCVPYSLYFRLTRRLV